METVQTDTAEGCATFANDIPSSLAVAAFSGTSFSPERRADTTRSQYAEGLAKDYATFKEHAERGGTLDKLEEEFARYRAGLAQRLRAYLASSSRCVSSMIAGPSNFPVHRMNKRADIAHKRLGEYLDFEKRARAAVIRNLRPDLAPIAAGDADAVERLTAELATLEAMQQRMKAVNAAHKAWQKNPASLDTCGLSDADKARIVKYKPQYSWEPHPFAPFQLTNNSANIRRIKARLEAVSKAKATPAKEFDAGNGVRVEDDPPANRVRIFFPGKPDAAVREKLKANGYRWAPTIGAWQAYRNHRAMQLAQGMVWDAKRAVQEVWRKVRS